MGTPVTAESFAVWRANKLAKRQADAEARALAELSKKKGSKGLCKKINKKKLFSFYYPKYLISFLFILFILSYLFLAVLTGKELFNFNSSLFVDDEGAIDAEQEKVMNNEMLALKIEEERKAKEEADRAQELYFISIQFNSIQFN